MNIPQSFNLGGKSLNMSFYSFNIWRQFRTTHRAKSDRRHSPKSAEIEEWPPPYRHRRSLPIQWRKNLEKMYFDRYQSFKRSFGWFLTKEYCQILKMSEDSLEIFGHKNLSVEIIPRFFSNVGTKLNKLLSQWRLTTKDEILPNQSSQRIFPEVERIK